MSQELRVCNCDLLSRQIRFLVKNHLHCCNFSVGCTRVEKSVRAYWCLEGLFVHPEWLKDPQGDQQALLFTEKTCLACSGSEVYLEHKECSYTRKSYLNTPSRKSTFENPEGPTLSHSRGRPGVLSAVGPRTQEPEAHPSSSNS